MKNGKYQVLIAGAGHMGDIHAAAYARIGNAEIAGVFDKDAGRADRFASKYGCRAYSTALGEALSGSGIDFADICLPSRFHKDAAIACFESGKDVLCEKPMALSVEDAKKMADARGACGRRLMVAQVVRFWPEYVKLASMIKNGEFRGAKNAIFSRYGERPGWSEGGWLLSDRQSGGILYDLVIHDIDFSLWVFGIPEWVYVKKTMLNPDYTGYLNAILGYDGMNVAIDGGFTMPDNYPFTAGFRVAGGDMALEYLNKDGRGLLLHTNEIAGEKLQYEDIDPYEAEIRYFISCMEKGEHPGMCTADEAIRLLHVLECMGRSADTDEKVYL